MKPSATQRGRMKLKSAVDISALCHVDCMTRINHTWTSFAFSKSLVWALLVLLPSSKGGKISEGIFILWNRVSFLSILKLTPRCQPFDFLPVSMCKIAGWYFCPSANNSTNDSIACNVDYCTVLHIGWISVISHASVDKHSKETINVST